MGQPALATAAWPAAAQEWLLRIKFVPVGSSEVEWSYPYATKDEAADGYIAFQNLITEYAGAGGWFRFGGATFFPKNLAALSVAVVPYEAAQ